MQHDYVLAVNFWWVQVGVGEYSEVSRLIHRQQARCQRGRWLQHLLMEIDKGGWQIGSAHVVPFEASWSDRQSSLHSTINGANALA